MWVDADGEVAVRLLGFGGFYWLKRADGQTVGVYASADDAISQFDGCTEWETPLIVKPYRYFDYLSDEDREWLRDNATAQQGLTVLDSQRGRYESMRINS